MSAFDTTAVHLRSTFRNLTCEPRKFYRDGMKGEGLRLEKGVGTLGYSNVGL